MNRVVRDRDRPTVTGTFMGYDVHRPACHLLKYFNRVPTISENGKAEYYLYELTRNQQLDWAEYHAPGFQEWLGLRYAMQRQPPKNRLEAILQYRDGVNTFGSADYKVAVELRAYAGLYDLDAYWFIIPEVLDAYMAQRERMPKNFPMAGLEMAPRLKKALAARG